MLEKPWYDQPIRESEDWPKHFEHARIHKVGHDPLADSRPEPIKRWRRPLSEEKIYIPWQQKELDK